MEHTQIIIGFILISFSLFILIKLRNESKFFKKYQEKLALMTVEQKISQTIIIQNNMRKYETSHVLHLFLSFFTAGTWLIIWVLQTAMNNSNKRKWENLLSCI